MIGLDGVCDDITDKCIALMEDIDAAFSHTLNRDEDGSGKRKKKSRNSSTSKYDLCPQPERLI